MSSRDRPRYSRSRSRSPQPEQHTQRYSRSRSRSRSPRAEKTGTSRRRSRSRSPPSAGRGHMGDRDAPEPSTCLGVFGLSFYTTERELEKEFSKFGPLERIQVILDRQSGRSRGFAFLYFEAVDDARAAKNAMSDAEIDGKRIRVDYSVTKGPHKPTPGIYMGRPTYSREGGRGEGYRDSRSDRYGGGGYDRHRGREYDRGYRNQGSSSSYDRRDDDRRSYRPRSYSPRRQSSSSYY